MPSDPGYGNTLRGDCVVIGSRLDLLLKTVATLLDPTELVFCSLRLTSSSTRSDLSSARFDGRRSGHLAVAGRESEVNR